MYVSKSIRILSKIYVLALSTFFLFRLILFFFHLDKVSVAEDSINTIIRAFIMGLRFDLVISGYLLLLPALALLIQGIWQSVSSFIDRIIFWWIFCLFSVAFAIAAADIPYFNQFYDRFSIGAFDWADNPDFVTSMIFQEPKYYFFILLFAVIIGLFYLGLKHIFRREAKSKKVSLALHVPIMILFIMLMVLGIRGRLTFKSPIRLGTAYFSTNSFLNKLGLNPVFTLMRSYLDSKSSSNRRILLMDDTQAIDVVRSFLDIKDKSKYNSPIARLVSADTLPITKPNVILIMMESMSAAKMARHGNDKKLTPFLDSLTHQSLYFNNVYTAGKHTHNGVFSTLFSFPGLYRRHSMKQIAQYDGISSTLKEHGYTTTYFTTHDSQFDNIEGFLRANDFENIVSQKNYPRSEVKTTLGVPDDFMFRFSIPILNDLANSEKPFFVSFMTTSDHGPYFIPDYFTPKHSDIKDQIVTYADWSLQQFIQLCASEPWFDNTLFVFVADHGAPMQVTYEIALNYFHTPLMFYGPDILPTNQINQKIGSQIDIFPTIMGILQLPYINNTLGIDLQREERPYAIINDDDKVGILDSTHLCIMKNRGMDLQLYTYCNRDKTDYYTTEKQKAEHMANYAKANIQVHQKMLIDKTTTIRSKK